MASNEETARAAFVAARQKWTAAHAAEEQAATELARTTHELMDTYSAAKMARWAAEAGEEGASEWSVRYWDVRWHNEHDVERDHPIVKPDRKARRGRSAQEAAQAG